MVAELQRFQILELPASVHACKYCKRGKIRWAKLSRIPPNVVFAVKTFTVPYVYNTKTTPLYEACIIKLIFTGKLSRCSLKPRKFSPANLSPFTVTHCSGRVGQNTRVHVASSWPHDSLPSVLI